MDTRAFLSRAVAWPNPGEGYINLHWHSGVKGSPFKGVAVETIDAFMRELEKARGYEENIYICTSTQREAKANGSGLAAVRNQPNALFLRAVFLDVDAKDYGSIDELKQAIADFLIAAKLPEPSAIVASGSGGYHLWWFADRPLIPGMWLMYAKELKRLANEHGLKIDQKVTTDSARVLRVPDTFNYKSDPPNPVVLKHLGKDYDLAALFPNAAKAPEGRVAPASLRGLPKLPARFVGRKVESAGAGIAPQEPITTLDPLPILTGCKFLREAVRTGGKDYDNFQWNITTLCATFMEKGNALAHKFADGYTGNGKHPPYNFEDTEQLWNRKLGEREAKGLGFPSCATIRDSGSVHCGGCRFFKESGGGKSPLHLARLGNKGTPGRDVARPGRSGVGVPSGEGDGANVATVKPIDGWADLLPERTKLAKDDRGGVNILISLPKPKDMCDPDDETETGFWFKPVFAFPIVNQPWAQSGPSGINLTIQVDVKRTKDIFIPASDFSNTKIWAKLFDLVCPPSKWMTPKTMEIFLVDWLSRMNSYVAATEQAPFGWLEENGSELPVGFAYGGWLFKNDGTKTPCPIIDPKMKKEYEPRGSREPWFKALDLVLKQNKPELEIIIASNFAGPLMRLIDATGALLSVYSTETGAHKSSASIIGTAVWGHGTDARETKGTSWKGGLARLGDTKNLTAHWDDLQTQKDFKTASETCLVLCQGNDGTKLKQNRTYHESKSWQTLCVALSNGSFVEYVIQHNKSNEAHLVRVFEVRFVKKLDEGIVKNIEATRALGALSRNFGHVGLEYAEKLANNTALIHELLTKENEIFTRAISKLSTEKVDESALRYWTQVCTVLLAGTRLANAIGVPLNYEAIFKRLVAAFGENVERRYTAASEGGSEGNTQNVLARFFGYAGAGYGVWTKGMAQKGGHGDKVETFQGCSPGKKCAVHYVMDRRLIRVSKTDFETWAQEADVNVTATVRGMKEHFNADLTHRYKLGAGTEFVRLPEATIEIPVPPGSPFEDMLFAHWPDTVEKPHAVAQADDN